MTFVSTTNQVTGHFTHIKVVSDAVFAVLTMPRSVKHEKATALRAAAGGTNAVMFPAGTDINGYITTVQLVSGAILIE